MNLCRLIMIVMMSHNTNNVDSNMLNKWHLHIIKIILKFRLADIIDCYNDNIIDKYM